MKFRRYLPQADRTADHRRIRAADRRKHVHLCGGTAVAGGPAGADPGRGEGVRWRQPRGASGYTYQRSTKPDRTEIIDSSGQPVAVMTDGARTAHIYGPSRTFEEPRFTDAKIETDMWVRLAPQAWRAGAEREQWFIDWLAAARNGPLAGRAGDRVRVRRRSAGEEGQPGTAVLG